MPGFRYSEASAHGGTLKYHGPLPVLTVDGDPAAVGRQVGALAMRPAARLLDYPLDYIRSQVKLPLLPRVLWALIRRKCRHLYANIPPAYRAEVDGITAACPDGGRLVPANTLFDMANMGLRPLFGCSALVIPAHRSAAGGVLFGRNLDFFPLGYLHDFSLVTVHRPHAGKLGFVSLGFPGFVGVVSGMNAAGLCLTRNEVLAPKVRRTFDAAGVPIAAALREVLETCRTTAEAVEGLSRVRHVTLSIVVVADPHHARIVEVTPDGVFAREVKEELTGCSNHFLDPATANPAQANLYKTLDRHAALREFAASAAPKVGVADVWAALGRVHQNELTLQSMVFDPAARAVHAAFGPGPTTDRTPYRLSVSDLLA